MNTVSKRRINSKNSGMVENLSKNDCSSLFREFGVSSEDELNKKLAEDAGKISCVECGKVMNIWDADYSTGDPICKSHVHLH